MENQTLTYAEVADKPLLQEQVKKVIDLDVSISHLTAVVSTNVAEETYAFDISALAEDPEMAIDIANATAVAMVDHVAANEPESNGEPILRMTVSASASEANSVLPGSPRHPTVGLITGLAIGVVLALVLPPSRPFDRVMRRHE
ncbi:hypothetical protein [Kocuria sediminis]|nr:hypothetical protein [Kocuria sediminis]